MKIKPCPFCGVKMEICAWPLPYRIGKRRWQYTIGAAGGAHKLRCPLCASIGYPYAKQHDAAVAWNRWNNRRAPRASRNHQRRGK